MKTSSQTALTLLRRSAKWLLLAAIIAFVVYRARFAPVPVFEYTASTGSLAAEVMGTGTLEARVKTTISPRIQERLAEVLVDQNDTVKAGQLLARLDDGELKMQTEVARAGLSAARATADRVRIDEARARAVEVQARQDHQRISELLVTKVSSQADLDKAIEQLAVAEAELKRAQSAILEADAHVLTAEKNLAFHNERLSYARILSPYDGLITRRDRDPGGVVVPGSSLLQLISTNEIWVSAWVNETALSGLAVGQPARVVFRSEPSRSYPGEVARLGREADRETREFVVDVTLRKLPRNWTVGQRAEVSIETARKSDVLVVPERFVVWRNGRPGVFAQEGSRAAFRPVILGPEGKGLVEIASGLNQGEVVLTPAAAKGSPLAPGVRVRPQTTPADAPPSS